MILKGYNVIAEIPGTDPVLKDEIVMLGGHLDSWHGATGATDNAAGERSNDGSSCVFLKQLACNQNAPSALHCGAAKKKACFGSRNYVKNHFADPADMAY